MDRRRLLLVVASVVAVLGVLLVFVYAHGADARAEKKYAGTEVLVAKDMIKPGESFDQAFADGKFETVKVAAAQKVDGAGPDADKYKGDVALTTIYPHEELIPAKFGGVDDVEGAATLPIPAGKMAISVLVKDDGRVGAFLRAGSQVAIIFTKTVPPPTGQPIYTRTLVDRVTVIGYGTRTAVPAAADGQAVDKSDTEVQELLTLAVTQDQAEKIRFAEKDGELTAALLNDASKVDPHGKPVREPDVQR